MKKIASFTIDHTILPKGMYLSRTDANTVTYDIRTRRPNVEEVMSNGAIHTLEHLFATFVRNSKYSNSIIYFGPMGCRTGFYLLMRDTKNEEAYALVKDILKKTVDHEGKMFGDTKKECGNYKDLSLESAKAECSRYLEALVEREKAGKADFKYDAE